MATRNAMTADQARSFQTFSATNAANRAPRQSRPVRHNGSHQELNEGAPMLYGDHMSDECDDKGARFPRDYAPGTGEREQDDQDQD